MTSSHCCGVGGFQPCLHCCRAWGEYSCSSKEGQDLRLSKKNKFQIMSASRQQFLAEEGCVSQFGSLKYFPITGLLHSDHWIVSTWLVFFLFVCRNSLKFIIFLEQTSSSDLNGDQEAKLKFLEIKNPCDFQQVIRFHGWSGFIVPAPQKKAASACYSNTGCVSEHQPVLLGEQIFFSPHKDQTSLKDPEPS